MDATFRRLARLLIPPALAVLIVSFASIAAGDPFEAPRPLAALPAVTQPPPADQVELGKMLFFDGRLSGDATLRCATCHDPKKGWTDGLALSIGYPGSLYFRNTPTVLNAVHGRYLYWDGRLPAADLPTVVRDHIAEAHFMQADGRLVIERLRQVPQYERKFHEAFGGEPTYGRILKAIAAFLVTLRSQDVPLDRHLAGDETALSDSAKRGLALFESKAGCIRCHHGPMLSDGKFHDLGLPANDEIFREPKRHITFRRFFRMLGVSTYANLRKDAGRYAVTKESADWWKFRTPTLREVSRTAPYMHDGSLATLDDVVEFYNRGGDGKRNESSLSPLGLTKQEKRDLVEFLKGLSGKPHDIGTVEIPPYRIRKLGDE